ncbi:helix-turn-helix domain-containing protein [Saccharopolyspora sp. 6M]|uniref:helix-turn-helix domain-containing protein n=1 Tax=Saccharopolyspora sp. 6M TaxID=2877237 RepID=UPI001CD80F1B|nr:helix-turn-helix domain-containing protein [Saccharopolyspora sp. 6M]MCA1229961.1 helix-turn-helix domain-containing protein [Saccharopolyspora sp. 6M]
MRSPDHEPGAIKVTKRFPQKKQNSSIPEPASSLLPLLTPREAAQTLAIKESWLRRKAGTREIPCTFIGRHLRFSQHDVQLIAQHGAEQNIHHK